MKSTYTIKEDEYVRANKLFSRPTKNTLYSYTLIFVMLAIAFITSDSFNTRLIITSTFIGALIGHAIARHIYAPWKTRKQFKVYKAVQEPVTLEHTAEGMHFKSEVGESFIEWNRVIKWRENNEFLLFYQAPVLYHIIPKRIGDTCDLIRESLIEHIGMAT